MKASELVGGLRDHLLNELRLIIRDAEDVLRNTGQQAGESYQVARSKFESTLGDAQTNLVQLEERAIERAREALETTDEYVHANPWQAVGAGAVAGLVVGLWLGRR
jgi:ElaB/YqjD/DUF883 family membrane-anchored ribosome-binding protein